MDALDIDIGTLTVRRLNGKQQRSIVYSWIKKNSLSYLYVARNLIIAQKQTRSSLKKGGEVM